MAPSTVSRGGLMHVGPDVVGTRSMVSVHEFASVIDIGVCAMCMRVRVRQGGVALRVNVLRENMDTNTHLPCACIHVCVYVSVQIAHVGMYMYV